MVAQVPPTSSGFCLKLADPRLSWYWEHTLDHLLLSAPSQTGGFAPSLCCLTVSQGKAETGTRTPDPPSSVSQRPEPCSGAGGPGGGG